MKNVLQEGLKWLEVQRHTHMASPALYKRVNEQGQIIEKQIVATIGHTELDVSDGYGTTIKSHATDFLILAEDLDFEPKAGDTIVFDDRIYEVMTLSGQGLGGHWQWSDPYHTTYRIHTKEIGAADE
ncbi:hypothetical protein KS4_10850 [Poriferisphaera corsica]|uniref:Phage head-tail joining protein domain-containing protein n=1 Tax=Poriferisphaera corsica TaxID=2528020 RepID=A0A517YS48_9BACT|nr:hypothetical protein [Poriferisphaera corsica]QDU33044.1 hypothetical protein KS4_10850 [Poriferisphaera corsica]